MQKKKHSADKTTYRNLRCSSPEPSRGVGCAGLQTYEAKTVSVVEPEPVFPLPVINLRGEPADIGKQHGEQLNSEIHFLVDTYLHPFFKTDSQRFIALTIAGGFRDKLLPRHQKELDALAQATQLDNREVLLAQCFLDLSKLMGCSTIALLPADASPTTSPAWDENLDFPSLVDVADKHTVIFIVHPNGKNAYCAVGWPGMMGVLSGMNERPDSVLCNMEVARQSRLPSRDAVYVAVSDDPGRLRDGGRGSGVIAKYAAADGE